ncbi:hypothetical protein [Cochleicola gelatinilyticus]|uniref:DUF1574 domain-containing protein n=1 Tax=Cochleicola gelatinilyticus TaxID=1763537 RepID=A0A167G7M1_9FLAO|nr:hypothetical protein [Cochleicola gelatinilyticus]OAB77300.1 hypothetical protein ULVI_12410 [Cochleicola gelatinilyticus]
MFFIPVIVVFFCFEYAVTKIPTNYALISDVLKTNGDTIKIAIFGSSQIQNSVNPEYIDLPSISFSSTSQHHNSDFEILKQTLDRLPKLEIVAFEVSYGHFEIPHNSKYFWKNNLYLKYYDVNTFQRTTYFKDRFLTTTRTGFFAKLLESYYIKKNYKYDYNIYGFDRGNYAGKFKKLNYNTSEILKSTIKKDVRIDRIAFKYNVPYFFNMLDFCKEKNLKVVIMSPPTFLNYNDKRYPDVLHRRDSILEIVKEKYQNIYFLNAEEDTDFTVKHFRNENHLNPDGAKVFTEKLNVLLTKIN